MRRVSHRVSVSRSAASSRCCSRASSCSCANNDAGGGGGRAATSEARIASTTCNGSAPNDVVMPATSITSWTREMSGADATRQHSELFHSATSSAAGSRRPKAWEKDLTDARARVSSPSICCDLVVLCFCFWLRLINREGRRNWRYLKRF